MKLMIDIDEKEYIEICEEPCTKLGLAIANGTPLDSIIADIEAARDKDKLCEYPYNRCIDILRRATEE